MHLELVLEAIQINFKTLNLRTLIRKLNEKNEVHY
jgi:hypothetical protein